MQQLPEVLMQSELTMPAETQIQFVQMGGVGTETHQALGWQFVFHTFLLT
jgi:hypothetical protein